MEVKRAAFRRSQFTELTNSHWEYIKELVDNGNSP